MSARALVAALALWVAGACGPIQRFPGGPLRGELVLEPVRDWAVAAQSPLAAVETRPEYPHSVTTILWGEGERLYVPARNPRGKKWVRNALEDPRVRLAIDGKLYLRRAVLVTDAAEIDAVRRGLAAKYQRPLPADPAALPETWIFRMDPR
jgi:hypothetical protein